MNFITTEYVKAEAEKGKLPALKCSLLHHEQGRDADWVELRDAIENSSFTPNSTYLCACCKMTNTYCRICPLGGIGKFSSDCCGGMWKKADSAFMNLIRNYSNANFKAFQDAEAKVCAYIEDELKALAKPELRCGDYGFTDRDDCDASNRSRIFINGKSHRENGSIGSGNADNWHKSGAYTILGNIFSDLARNAEDLTRTSVEGFVLETISERINIGGRRFFIDQAIDFHQKLGQLIATAKRKQNLK